MHAHFLRSLAQRSRSPHGHSCSGPVRGPGARSCLPVRSLPARAPAIASTVVAHAPAGWLGCLTRPAHAACVHVRTHSWHCGHVGKHPAPHPARALQPAHGESKGFGGACTPPNTHHVPVARSANSWTQGLAEACFGRTRTAHRRRVRVTRLGLCTRFNGDSKGLVGPAPRRTRTASRWR